MKKSMGRYCGLGILVVVLAIAGCATTGGFTRDAYRGLSVSAATYDTTMKSLGDLYSQGLIGDAEKQKAIEYGTYFWVAYHAASDAIEAYMTTNSLEDKEKVQRAMVEISKALAKFLGYVKPILLEKGGK